MTSPDVGRRSLRSQRPAGNRERRPYLTAEADPLHPEVSRDGLSEYVADGVLLLGYRTGADGHRVGLSLRVLKMRRTAHVRTVQPYAIGPNGLTVDAKAVDFGGP